MTTASARVTAALPSARSTWSPFATAASSVAVTARAVTLRLRAQVGAAEALAATWERPGPLPDGRRCAGDVAQAAAEVRRALDAARRGT
ncbi:MAG TPA: hypothetical protein VGO94_07065 [Mycobacteriales bacterium]|nr:hypothetical protein [Mycobacteriales bacterium]